MKWLLIFLTCFNSYAATFGVISKNQTQGAIILARDNDDFNVYEGINLVPRQGAGFRYKEIVSSDDKLKIYCQNSDLEHLNFCSIRVYKNDQTVLDYQKGEIAISYRGAEALRFFNFFNINDPDQNQFFYFSTDHQLQFLVAKDYFTIYFKLGGFP